MSKALLNQIERTKKNLKPTALIIDGCKEMTKLIEIFFKYLEKHMDKQIKKVEKDVDKGDKKKAKKDISKLLKMDKKFDKEIEKCKTMKKKK